VSGVHRLLAEGARGVRVDQFLAGRLEDLSRARIQALIASGALKLDGRAVRASYRLKGSEVLELVVPELAPAEPQAEALPISVLYQDSDIAVVDKAAGMVVHPGAGHASGTLVNALLHHVGDLQGIGGSLRPGLVHRLDKDTSGVLVIAKNDRALGALQAAFKSRDVEKTYLALVYGQPPAEGTFDTLHGRHPTSRLRFTGKVKTGKRAITHYRVTRRFALGALVEISLETGRTHQIRVHFAEAGFPLLGDQVYGTARSKRVPAIDRQALHSYRLEFRHPRTNRPLCFEAPVPCDFERAQAWLTTGQS
jgi:23S rRNA pseudouridine1911/1915/1917 synthase